MYENLFLLALCLSLWIMRYLRKGMHVDDCTGRYVAAPLAKKHQCGKQPHREVIPFPINEILNVLPIWPRNRQLQLPVRLLIIYSRTDASRDW